MTEQVQQDLMSLPVSELIKMITELQADVNYGISSALEDGYKKSYQELIHAIKDNVDFDPDDEELSQMIYNIFYSFLSRINKPYWDNPFKIKKMWDVEVELNNESFTVIVEADNEEDAIEKVTDNLEVKNKRQSFTVSYQDDDNRESMDMEFEGDDCDMDDDDCLDGIRMTATRNTD